MTKKKKKNYLNNEDFLEQLIISKKQKKMTDKLARMFMSLVNNYAKKGNWFQYSYIDDIKSATLLHLCRIWWKFDEKKYDNPFAYFTQSTYNIFLQELRKEAKHHKIRDLELIRNGFNPSFSFTLEHEEEQRLNRMESDERALY